MTVEELRQHLSGIGNAKKAFVHGVGILRIDLDPGAGSVGPFLNIVSDPAGAANMSMADIKSAASDPQFSLGMEVFIDGVPVQSVDTSTGDIVINWQDG